MGPRGEGQKMKNAADIRAVCTQIIFQMRNYAFLSDMSDKIF
jgi:hypothetical protein